MKSAQLCSDKKRFERHMQHVSPSYIFAMQTDSISTLQSRALHRIVPWRPFSIRPEFVVCVCVCAQHDCGIMHKTFISYQAESVIFMRPVGNVGEIGFVRVQQHLYYDACVWRIVFHGNRLHYSRQCGCLIGTISTLTHRMAYFMCVNTRKLLKWTNTPF
jgi:hypothetical protein